MLSYRHAFHAGSFADLLKHLVLCQIIDYLKKKPSPIRYIDTHAGAGLYDITADKSTLTGEFARGAGALDYQGLPESISLFREIVTPYLKKGQYPGSPLIAANLLREQDELRLFELHNTDFPLLQDLFAGDRRVRVMHEDGFLALKALLPVKNARALVLIDPSYELQQDYNQVVNTLQEGYARMPHGVFALWYPVIDTQGVSYLLRHVKALTKNALWQYELDIGSTSGMSRCGMIVLNPPWNLGAELDPLLAALERQLTSGGVYKRNNL